MNETKFATPIWLTKKDLRSLALLAGEMSITEYTERIIRDHITRELSTHVTIHASPDLSTETKKSLSGMIEAAFLHLTGGILVWVCDNCKVDYSASQSMCISCGKRRTRPHAQI